MDVYQRRRLVALSAIAVVFVIIVLLIRSCGDDDEPATTSAPIAGATGVGGATAQPKTDFIDQADRICLEANTTIDSIETTDEAQVAAEEAQTLAGEIEQLQTLVPPDEDENSLEAFLKAVQKQANALSDQVTALERGDTAAAAELDATIDEAAAKAGRIAKRFGFEACGDPTAVGEASGGEGDGEETTDAAATDSGGVAPATTTPAVPVEPAPTTTPAAPPADTGTQGGVGTEPAAPADSGGTGSSSGGVSP